MTVHDGDYCIRVERDADGYLFLALYHGTAALGAPVAECYFEARMDGSFLVPSLVVTTGAADVPASVLAWFRDRAQYLLPPPGALLPDFDVERQPLWYYVGGAVILLGWAAQQWRHAAAHVEPWTGLLVVCAGLLLYSGYRQHRRERKATIYRPGSPLE